MTQIGKQKGTKVSYSPHVQQVVTASRVVSTVYQNTTGRPMFVSVSGNSTAVGGNITAYTDSNAAPTTVVGYSNFSTAGYGQQVFFIVLPSNYYKVAISATAALDFWVEWY